jgi:four helix bundle protein
MDLAVEVYGASVCFPAEERFGLVSQLRRAAVSIPSNIAEGHARRSRPEFLHHLSIALGSAAELGTPIELAGRLGYLPADPRRLLDDRLATVARMIHGLRRSLSNPQSPPPNPSPGSGLPT